MKYTEKTLDKIGKLIEETGYIVRYERGSFQSGFCILEDRKVVVEEFECLNVKLTRKVPQNKVLIMEQVKIVIEIRSAENSPGYTEANSAKSS